MYQKIKNNIDIIYKILLIMLTVIFLLRLLWLDIDLPSEGLSYYQPIDEGLYSKMALNLFNSGSLYKYGNINFYTAPSYRANILGNILQYVFLNILGDNYYAFRLPYVIFSIVLLIYTLKTIKLICRKKNISSSIEKIVIISLYSYMCVDFQYLMASRIVENSILRAMFLSIIVYYYLKIDNIKWKYFLTSFLSTFSIFLVYFSNLFIVIPFIFILFFSFFIEKDKNKTGIILKYSCFGFLLALLLSELYYGIVWQSGAFHNLFLTLFDYSSRIVGSGKITSHNQYSNIFVSIFFNSVYFFGSNMFLFNFPFLILSGVSVVYNVKKCWNKKNGIGLFIMCIVISYFIQGLFASDMMERKSFVIYPILLISVSIFLLDIYQHKNVKTLINKYKLLIIFFIIYGGYACYQTKLYRDYYLDLTPNEIKVLFFSVIFQMFICIFILFLSNKKIRSTFMILSIFCSLLTNSYFSTKYVYFLHNYTEKQIMIDMGNDVGDNPVLWGYAYGYTLYNEIKPVTCKLEDYKKYLLNNDAIYFCHYSSVDNSSYLNEEIFGKKEPSVYLYKSYLRFYRSDGIEKQIGLFKKIDVRK